MVSPFDDGPPGEGTTDHALADCPLSPVQRRLVTLYFDEGKDLTEVASVLDLGPERAEIELAEALRTMEGSLRKRESVRGPGG